MLSSRYIYFITILSLTACGGGEAPAEKAAITSAGEPSQSVTSPTVDLSGQSGTSASSGVQVGGTTSNSNANVDDKFANAVGTIRHISAEENVQGNLTLGATASDEDTLTKVSLYLPKVERAFVLCESNCPANFRATITGFNPQLADVVAGPLRIELIVEDSLGNRAVVDALSINWQPIQISAINASRADGNVSISWSGNSSIQRYNVYAATQHGITALNALDLDNGMQRLAIKGTSLTFIDAAPSKDYHLFITGIDNGGESGKSAPFIIPRTVGAVNQPPVANNENFQVNEDESITVNVLENDLDPEGQLLQIESILQQPANGSVNYDDAGNLTYKGNLNFNGTDSVSYRIWDTEGATAEATVFFEVLAVNDAPIAVDDTYGVDPSGKITASETDLLSNDSDIDGDTLQVSTTPVTAPQQGAVVINSDGSFSYQSTGVLTTSDTFVYQVLDGNGGTANATVTILPNGNILPPIARNDNYQVDEDTTLVIDSIDLGILANDSDPNGLAFTLQESLVIEPAHGQLNLSLDGTFTYIPNSNFAGTDRFQYQIKNSADIVAQAFVIITVLPVTDIPIAQDDNYVAEEDVTLVVDASLGLLINDVDFDNLTLTVNTTPVSAPQKGTLILAPDGSFSYTPNADFNGVDSFTYQISNEAQLTDTANVNIVISPSNDAPTVIDDSVTINEDTTALIDVLANDSDVDGDDISLSSVTSENGSALIVNGQVQIAPTLNFFGQYNVTYTAEDSFGASTNGNLVVTVLPVNDAPLAVNDSYSLLEDTVLSVLVSDTSQLLSNDSDIDGDTLTVNTTPVSNVSNGSLTLSSNGAFVYSPSVNFNGTDSFTYQVSDGNGGTAQASVTLTVSSLNDIPVASADSFTLDEDNVLTKLASDSDNLLSNDIDADGDTLTVNTTPISNVSNGSLTLNSDGSFVYTPSVNFNGTDSFTYQVSDGNGGTANASVSLTINSINDIPVVVGESYSIDEDTTLTKLVTDLDHLLINDSDVDGDTLTVNTTPVSNVSNGSLTLSSNGAFVYSPSVNFNGTDSFTYQVSDGNGGTAQASVTLTVNSLNDIPVASADSYIIDEDIVLTKLVSDSDNLLSNDIDADGDTLTVNTTPISNVSNGSLTLNSDGSFVYTPSVNFNGTDSFTYQVSDGNGGTANASVSLTINSINDIPVLADDDYSVDEDAVLSVLVSDSNQLLSNDSDVDGDTLTVNTTPVSNVSNGTLTLSSNGAFVYTPSVNFNGTDSFTYQVSDGNGGTAQASVTLTVNSINDIPVPSADNFSVDEDNVLTKLVSDSDNLLDNDNDADGDTLTVNTTPISNVSNGSLTLNSDGSFVYTPSVNFNGTDGFTYQVSDGNGGTANANVSITVDAINDLPVVSGESYGFNEDNTLTKLVSDSDNLLSNASDVDGDTLSVNTTAVTDVNDGTLTLNSDGSFIYVPDADFNGTDSFTYEVQDGNGGKVNGNVSLTINALNDAPIAVNDSYSFNEDFTWVRFVTDGDQLLSNDSDVDGDTLTVETTPITDVNDGTLTLNSDGSFTYVPDANFNGTDSFTYRINDGNGETAQATANLTIHAINDAPVVTGESYTFNEDITLTKLVSDSDNLLSNASDVDGDTLTVNTTAVTDVNDGTLTLNSDGSFIYVPDANFNGTDSFTYQVLDGEGGTVNGNVSLTINAVNDLPTTVADAVSLDEDVPLAITFASLLANDSDIDGDTLSIDTSAIPTATKGVLTISGSSFIYTPTANLNGTDSFTYKVDDGSGTLVNGTVNLTINAINDLPTTGTDTFSLDEDDPLTITFASLLANDNDIDGDTLSVDTSAIPTATKGVLTISGSSFIYTPTANLNGTDTFTYKIDDGSGTLVNGTVNLTIDAINDLPTTGTDTFSLDEDVPLAITFADLLANDNDVDADTLTVDTSAIPSASKGVLTISGSSFIYTPSANLNGTDTFTYKIDDGSGTLINGTVNLTINAINDLPTTVTDTFSLDEDVPLAITFVSLLSNDNDIDGDTLSVDTSAIPTASKGVLTIDGSTFQYTPTANLNGTDSFTYKIDDGSGTLVDGTVNLTINAINDAPVGVDDSYTFAEDVTLAKLVSDGDNLLGNDTDVESDTLTITLDTDVSNGTLTLGSDGSFSYVPDANFNGADSFVYQVDDGNGGTDTATVSLTIQAVNDAPLASPQTFSVVENGNDGDVVGSVVASDIEADTLTYSLTAGDTGLFQIDSASGEITVKGTYPLDYETNTQHTVTVTIDDDGSPTPESTDVVITIDVTDIPGDAVLGETAGFGRAALGSLELTGIKTQPQLNKSVTVGSKVYFIGSIDNVDKDVYVVAYNDDSTLDATFGTNGKQTFDFGDNEYGKGIAEISGNLYLIFDRDFGAYSEACFLRVDATGAIDTGFADNGLRCTTDEKLISINDAVYMPQPIVQGVSEDSGDWLSAIVAVGKVQDNAGDDTDTFITRIDEDGNFIDFTPLDTGDSKHMRVDVSASNLDDVATTLYNPHNVEIMLAGNVETGADSDIFTWIINPKNMDLNYDRFNSTQPLIIDVTGNNQDDQMGAINGKNTGAGEHTAHLAGSTFVAGEQDAFILEIDSDAGLVTAFGTNGVAIYDVDNTVSVGTSEFTGYQWDYTNDEMYLTGNIFDGSKVKPFATRILPADGAVDSVNYGIGGYKIFNYADGNAYALGMSLDSVQTMWIPGYVESGADKIMTISSVDNIGEPNEDQFESGKKKLTHSSTASDDIVAQVIQIQDLAQQGKYLVASTADNTSDKHIILTRFTSAGLLDTSFDTDGHKQLKIGTNTEVKGLFELADGNYIVYGNVTEASVDNGFVARIDQNGVLDATFATDGIYNTAALGATNIHFNQVKADSAGNLVAVGNYDLGSLSAFVLRLTSAGALDATFNTLDTQGYVVGANTDDYFALEIDASNNIYAGGNRNTGRQDMLLVKYLSTGLVDSTFNSNTGELVVDVAGGDDNIEFVGFDSNDDLYLVGNELDPPLSLTLLPLTFNSDDRIGVVKTSTSGDLIAGFGSNGKARLRMSSSNSGMTQAAIDTNDNIVVVGFTEYIGEMKQMLGRITPTGSLDDAFDFDGYSRDLTCSNDAQLESLVLLNNSSFVVAGQCYIDATYKNDIDVIQFQLN